MAEFTDQGRAWLLGQYRAMQASYDQGSAMARDLLTSCSWNDLALASARLIAHADAHHDPVMKAILTLGLAAEVDIAIKRIEADQ